MGWEAAVSEMGVSEFCVSQYSVYSLFISYLPVPSLHMVGVMHHAVLAVSHTTQTVACTRAGLSQCVGGWYQRQNTSGG